MVLCGRLAGVGGHLLEEGQHLGRGRGVGLVEEGDDVLGFALGDISFGLVEQRAIEMSDLAVKDLQSQT